MAVCGEVGAAGDAAIQRAAMGSTVINATYGGHVLVGQTVEEPRRLFVVDHAPFFQQAYEALVRGNYHQKPGNMIAVFDLTYRVVHKTPSTWPDPKMRYEQDYGSMYAQLGIILLRYLRTLKPKSCRAGITAWLEAYMHREITTWRAEWTMAAPASLVGRSLDVTIGPLLRDGRMVGVYRTSDRLYTTPSGYIARMMMK
jgi:hypothetical protein